MPWEAWCHSDYSIIVCILIHCMKTPSNLLPQKIVQLPFHASAIRSHDDMPWYGSVFIHGSWTHQFENLFPSVLANFMKLFDAFLFLSVMAPNRILCHLDSSSIISIYSRFLVYLLFCPNFWYFPSNLFSNIFIEHFSFLPS